MGSEVQAELDWTFKKDDCTKNMQDRNFTIDGSNLNWAMDTMYTIPISTIS